MLKSIGILGGIFNLFYLGYLMMVNEVLYVLKLDEIWFMLLYILFYKIIKEFIELYYCLYMLKLVIEEYD